MRTLFNANTGFRLGYTHQVCEAGKRLLSLLAARQQEIKQLTWERDSFKEDVESTIEAAMEDSRQHSEQVAQLLAARPDVWEPAISIIKEEIMRQCDRCRNGVALDESGRMHMPPDWCLSFALKEALVHLEAARDAQEGKET